MYSVGKLAIPNRPKVKLIDENLLLFNWLPETQGQFNRHTDQATFVAYNEVKKIIMIVSIPQVTRSSLLYHLVLPQGFSNDPLHCYMSFTSADGKTVSDSVYVGLAYG